MLCGRHTHCACWRQPLALPIDKICYDKKMRRCLLLLFIARIILFPCYTMTHVSEHHLLAS
jgi:hypothetical protein